MLYGRRVVEEARTIRDPDEGWTRKSRSWGDGQRLPSVRWLDDCCESMLEMRTPRSFNRQSVGLGFICCSPQLFSFTDEEVPRSGFDQWIVRPHEFHLYEAVSF